MNILIQVIGVGVIGALIALLLKEAKPNFATLVSISTCVIILLLVIKQCESLLGQVSKLFSKVSYSSKIIETALKVVGIGYIIEFASDIVEDSGMTSIAKKIVLAGKIIVAGICLPFVIDLFVMIEQLL